MKDLHSRSHLLTERRAVRSLSIVIVGAGIAGLTAGLGLRKAGHRVMILEQATQFEEAGAGIQLSPNATKILHRFGVLDDISKHADALERISQRRYADNQELGLATVMPAAGRRYGAPALIMHRADLHRSLVLAAKKAGCQISSGQRVTAVNAAAAPRVQTADGTWYQGDLVLGADGFRSAVRKHVAAAYGHSEHLTPTGDAAYRFLIPRDKLAGNREVLELMSQNTAVRWIGPRGHVMAYPIKHSALLNVVILHPDSLPSETTDGQGTVWTTTKNKADALDFCRGWCPTVQDMLACVPDGDIFEWHLYHHAPLKHWYKDRVALIGDACHPMLPYTAQGAANAIEDAGALVTALTCTSRVDLALAAYQQVRLDRSAEMQAGALTARSNLHLPDGPEQRARDEAIRRATDEVDGDGGGDLARNPDLWADRQWQDFAWGADVMKATVQGCVGLVAGGVQVRVQDLGPRGEAGWRARVLLCDKGRVSKHGKSRRALQRLKKRKGGGVQSRLRP
ncbi:hypothetical protein HIM_07819 [Hirsutella minnesotensis 3608]|uniref:FAD-binding domain-containing protein n=1 Tax=Hirsutella minnesotensis 3608 TaxID=1043627 RepID=A0A0F7ZMZ8_9HYPO|nr:hypothetical protein HIM_07819 [Hirsutella minnesotensis 3608]